MAKVVGINDGVGKSNATVQAVTKTLDAWCEWAPHTTRGVLTPYQFLAVVLWAIQTEATNPEDEVQIVTGWAKALLQSSSTFPALHPVTLLALEAPTTDWVLSVTHAQEFLDSMPIGFRLELVLEHFRSEANKLKVAGNESLTYKALVILRIGDGKGKPWTDDQVQIALAAVKANRGKKVAKDMGLFRQPLTAALSRKRDNRGPEKRANFPYRGLTG